MLWATSPLKYLTAPPAHPTGLRARRGSCRSAPSRPPGRAPRSPRPAAQPGPPLWRPLEVRMRFIGLDLHKCTVEGCALDPAGRVVLTRSLVCGRAELERFARDELRPDDHVALEATTNTW